MKFRSALVAATMLALPLAANAQPITGLYVGGAVGGNFLTEHVASGGVGGDLVSRIGPAAAISLGYGLGNGLRAEVEGDFRQNTFNKVARGPRAGGQEIKPGVMVNVLYDFVGLPYVQPYVGVGAGYQWTKLNSVTSVQPGGPFGAAISSQSGAFAGQAIIGASFPVPNVPGLSFTADYRFMDILGGEKMNGVSTGGAGFRPATLKTHNQFNHDLVFGIRYAFNTPAPAAPPMAPEPAAAPAPAPARSYLVFFDWDRADLTARARSIVKEAADNSTRVQVTRIEVNGYTDTSGKAQYNQALSVRRAKAVAGELVRDGVPQNVINIQGFGDTHLLVPTGPGVREPQNRRVEIIIR
jgi:OmpA-OmpF porin, OOP family